jgi:hypothetical protein
VGGLRAHLPQLAESGQRAILFGFAVGLHNAPLQFGLRTVLAEIALQ